MSPTLIRLNFPQLALKILRHRECNSFHYSIHMHLMKKPIVLHSCHGISGVEDKIKKIME